MRAALALFITGGVALAAGALGFQAGVASSIGTAGGTVIMGGGFHVFGFLFLGFLAFLFLTAIFGRRRMHHGPWGMHGAMGPGGFGPGGPMGPHGPMADARRAWVTEAHRRLHEEEARRASGQAGTGDATPTSNDRPTGPAAG
ncbi:MAG: hypothetical protein WCK58_12630 [Chloroflexota bacterium]